MSVFSNWASAGLSFLGSFFFLAAWLLAAAIALLFVLDRAQSKDAIRRNYPVIGRFRYLFTHLGDFFRQYFFALDREEMPFNRAEREWIYESAQGKNNTQPFGSTLNITLVGTPIFINCGFPMLDEEAKDPPPVTFGPYTPNPYAAASVINISGMSYGALSAPAITAFSHGAQQAGCWLNTGEGGVSPYHLAGECDLVFQIGTAKYGVRDANGALDEKRLAEIGALPHVKMVEIKLAQGAKPGKGGMLPGAKVTAEIATIRGIEQGEPSLSPNRHPEIENMNDLLDYIERIRTISRLPTGIKTVLGDLSWVQQLCDAVEQRGLESAPDFITLDGGDGGTGAAPMSLMDNVGLSLREALPLLVDLLERRGLKNRIKVIASGKLVTPAEVAWAYCAGADVVNCARGFMFSIGCIQAMRCHTNNCPTGITTHKAHLQGGLTVEEKAPQVARYIEKMRKDVAMIAHSCGAPHARALKRHHVRIVQADGGSVPLDVLCRRWAEPR